MDDPSSPYLFAAALPAGGAAANGSTQALLLYLSLALGVSFLCSLLEAVILTVSHAQIAMLEETNARAGGLLKRQKENIDQSLAAILTLNTVAHTVGAAGVGAQVLYLYGNSWVAAGSAALTILILVFSEIVPKTLGAVHSRALAPFSASAIRALLLVTYPIVVALEWISDLFTPARSEARYTLEEMVRAAQIGEEEGTLAEAETDVIENLLALRRIRVEEVMTPRSVMKTFQAEKTVADAAAPPTSLRFSRIPVYGEDVDDIRGIVLRHTLLAAYANGEADSTMESLAKPVESVPESMSVAAVLDAFIRKRNHIFIVTDEFGGTAGLITLEDAIETLLGVEIVDETDAVADLRQLAKERERIRRLVRQRRDG